MILPFLKTILQEILTHLFEQCIRIRDGFVLLTSGECRHESDSNSAKKEKQYELNAIYSFIISVKKLHYIISLVWRWRKFGSCSKTELLFSSRATCDCSKSLHLHDHSLSTPETL